MLVPGGPRAGSAGCFQPLQLRGAIHSIVIRKLAVPLLDESLAISSELGMRPLIEWVLYRRDILKA